ncbi:hypothetical protein COLO4_20186 [Corchorus olitorius]|uniref:Uncharacterized protein n=1 Tax=Corchorus olitorius TaxID=93759 RepID=A0A1R3J1D6_9ROSI|nr:hypothetical protein COLO4_20186 [Corchorus olitorius]
MTDIQAEQWVSKMSGSAEDEAVEVEPEGRPEKSVWFPSNLAGYQVFMHHIYIYSFTEISESFNRLGLGAKVPRHQSKVVTSNNPVERKLYAKLDAAKRKASKDEVSTTPLARDAVDDDSDDEDLDSRSSAFGTDRKRAVPPISQLQTKKKQK